LTSINTCAKIQMVVLCIFTQYIAKVLLEISALIQSILKMEVTPRLLGDIMGYSFYPGCTLKNKASRLEISALESARLLNKELKELPEWQCCGAVYPLARDEIVTILGSIRSLIRARELGNKLVTLCAACHHVLKRSNWAIKNKKDVRDKTNNFLQDESDYFGETEVIHYLEFLRDEVGFDKIKSAAQGRLKGKRVGAYYGCLLLRPEKELKFDNPEQPTIMEDFIRSLGGQPVEYPFRNECCGGYLNLKNPESAHKMGNRIISSATEHSAEEIITACPLCLYNLNQSFLNGNSCENSNIKVTYFTELLYEVLDPTKKEVAYG